MFGLEPGRESGSRPFQSVPAEILMARLERVAGRVRERGLGALVAYSAPLDLGNSTRTIGYVRYLTNWSDRNQPAVLVVPADGPPVLVVYGGPARTVWPAVREVPVSDVRDGSTTDLGKVVAHVAQDRRIGIAGLREMRAPLYLQLAHGRSATDLVEADDLIDGDRVVKDPWEVQRHETASAISDAMLEAFFRSCRPGREAWRCLAAMEATGRSLGAEYASGWVATGPRLSGAHYNLWQHLRILEMGDLVAAGTNVVFDGYWGHELRMGVIGTVPRGLRERYAHVIDAQDVGVAALRAGTPLRDIANAVNGAINDDPGLDRSGFRGNECHALGLQYNDPIASEALVPTSGHNLDARLGMVIEIHPNYSVKRYGYLCVGDVFLVTNGAPRPLTSRPREIVAL